MLQIVKKGGDKMATEAQKRAKKKYQKEKTVGKYIQLNKETDKDILSHIQDIPFQTYIKKLIRRDIENGKKGE